jgi:hypothetical protein
MSLLISFLLLGSCTIVNLKSRCDKCDISIAVTVINDNSPTRKLIDELFCTVEDSCLKNVEFMESFNEALFVSLERKPGIFTRQFSASSKQQLILKQLEAPVHDRINLDLIIEKINKDSAKKNGSIDKILTALRVAKSKSS